MRRVFQSMRAVIRRRLWLGGDINYIFVAQSNGLHSMKYIED